MEDGCKYRSLDVTVREKCGEAFCSVNPAVSERQSGGPNGWWRLRYEFKSEVEIVHAEESSNGEEEKREEGKGREEGEGRQVLG